VSEQAILAIIAILASTVGALIYVIKYMFDKILPILESMQKSVDRNTEATKSNDEYLRYRNGRDNEMHEQVLNSLRAIENRS